MTSFDFWLLAIIVWGYVAGSTLAGMLLGHWYLIAPDLSFRPLRRAVYLIFAALGVQAAAVAVALLTADGAVRV